MRRAAKRDQSERDIITALRLMGWSVLPVSVANGPDLFASKGQRTVAIECKTGTRKLRPGQAEWSGTWQGEYVVLRSVEDAMKFHLGREIS